MKAPLARSWQGSFLRRQLTPAAVWIVAQLAVVLPTLWRAGLHWDAEMALFPWLGRQGWILYRDIKDQHPPLLPAVLSLLPSPGSPQPELVFTILLTTATLLLLYVVTWNVAGPLAAAVASCFFSAWTLASGQLHLWYDLVLGPFYLAALLLALLALDRRGPWRFLALGLTMGLAMLVKQHAVLVALAGLLLPLARGPSNVLGPGGEPDRGSRLVQLASYVVGLVIPLAATAGAYVLAGAAGDLFFWTVGYNLGGAYASEGASPVPAGEWGTLVTLYVPAAALALGMLAARRGPPDRQERPARLSWAFWVLSASALVAATLAAWPRYSFFHLAAAVPLLSLAFGVGFAQALKLLKGAWAARAVGLAMTGAAVVLLLAAALLPASYQALRTGRQVWRSAPEPEPFSTTAGPLKAWVQARTAPDEPVWIYDVDPTLYRVLERPPARPWTPLFPWIMTGDDTVDQWIAGVQSSRPKLAIVSIEFTKGRSLPLPDAGRSEAILRSEYADGPEFSVRKYSDSPLQGIVVLQRLGP